MKKKKDWEDVSPWNTTWERVYRYTYKTDHNRRLFVGRRDGKYEIVMWDGDNIVRDYPSVKSMKELMNVAVIVWRMQ